MMAFDTSVVHDHGALDKHRVSRLIPLWPCPNVGVHLQNPLWTVRCLAPKLEFAFNTA